MIGLRVPVHTPNKYSNAVARVNAVEVNALPVFTPRDKRDIFTEPFL